MDRRLRVALLVAVQLAILAAIPARQVLARARGQEITLLTAPVDPFNPFGGYYMTLSYEAERVPAFENAPSREPGRATAPRRGGLVYLIVEKKDPAWTLVGVSERLPAPAPGRAVLRARWAGWRAPGLGGEATVGAEIESAGRFYLPEAKAKALEKAMADEWKRVRTLPVEQWQSAQRTRMLVDLKVDDAGNVGLVRLRFGGLTFEE